jgi:hypothetical protein
MNAQTWGKFIGAQAPAAQRFNSMLRTGVSSFSSEKLVAKSCVLHIESGFHAGAQIRLRNSPVSVGSAPDNDVVLHDAGVQPHHAELRRVDGVWDLFVISGTQSFPPLETTKHGLFVRHRHGLGAAGLVISQQRERLPAKPWAVRSIHWRRAVAPLLFVVAAAVGGGALLQLVKPAEAQMTVGERRLANEGWPDVRVVVDERRFVTVQGYVDDAPSLTRLGEWLQANGFSKAEVTVRVGTELATRVRESLEGQNLQVDYQPGGRVRVQGNSSQLALRTQLQRLAADLASVVKVDDLVVYTEAPEPPKQRPLPFRILSVSPGENGSFSTDTGARFFVGGLLNDGAEVVAITADSVEFKIGEKKVLFPLN